ncbi:hypothetical protein SPF06_00935 [Sinomonas sp. JGH33]|uniref:Uncharacterized protein n=1 Tax=Sinomonas terricola TaxID=3110330 RepID=A0ABU5T112_9MICC|nr:hypothetical protein [Sinomonas sp. JGH33]MEA5453275.1 hypothetical protein [Sinomonas sp. JGH33]
MTPNKEEMAREAVYRQQWIEEHKRADETVFDPKTGIPVAAIYRYPPLAHYRENQEFWNQLADAVAKEGN